MKSKATPRFWKLYGELPAHAQRLARKNYSLWWGNHDHSSLAFKKLKRGSNTRFSVRVGDHYRAIGQIVGDTVEWVWIGSREDYNHLCGLMTQTVKDTSP